MQSQIRDKIKCNTHEYEHGQILSGINNYLFLLYHYSILAVLFKPQHLKKRRPNFEARRLAKRH